MKSVAIVTGGSGGIGHDVVKLLSDAGYITYELSRSGKSFDGVVHIDCDVSDPDTVEMAVAQVIREQQRIDLLVNNAGMGISGAIEFTSEEYAKRIFDVNFFGSFHLIRSVVPTMREQKSGRIISITSVAGIIPIPFQAFYSATKSALLSLTRSLRNELQPFGISVTAIQPGDIATGFTDSRKKEHEGDEFYAGRISRSVSRMEKDEQNGMPSSYAAKRICKIAKKKHVKPMYSIGFLYQIYSVLFPLLPSALSSWIVRLLYAR